MAAKQCYRNSFILASTERGYYCEGFAMKEGDFPFHHAWIVTENGHAVDVTLEHPEEYFLLGIQFSYSAFLTLANGGYGLHGFLRPPFDKDLLLEAIESSRRDFDQ